MAAAEANTPSALRTCHFLARGALPVYSGALGKAVANGDQFEVSAPNPAEGFIAMGALGSDNLLRESAIAPPKQRPNDGVKRKAESHDRPVGYAVEYRPALHFLTERELGGGLQCAVLCQPSVVLG